MPPPPPITATRTRAIGMSKKGRTAFRPALIPKPTRATSSMVRLKTRKVRVVPMVGISTRVGRNVPMKEPMVEIP